MFTRNANSMGRFTRRWAVALLVSATLIGCGSDEPEVATSPAELIQVTPEPVEPAIETSPMVETDDRRQAEQPLNTISGSSDGEDRADRADRAGSSDGSAEGSLDSDRSEASDTTHAAVRPEVPSRHVQADPVRLGDTADCAVRLNRAVTALGVENREPVGADSHFVARGEPVYVFMEVNNPLGPEREMTIRWNHLGSDHSFSQTIPAGVSPSWRTWVYHTILPERAGEWEVEILAPNNCSVAELRFTAS